MKTHLLTLVIALCTVVGASTAQADTPIYEPYCFTNLAGLAGTSGSANGAGTAAQFNQPWGLAVDSAGNVYVADTLNHTIRKTTPSGAVTLLAGVAGSAGFTDGPANTAQFSRPTGVAVNGAGTVVLVADYNNHRIRQVSGGTVSTLAGSGTAGTTDATGLAAEFRNPFGVALKSAGTMAYVTDQNNQTIRTITIPGGIVTTLAGAATVNGYVDGANSAARFNTPRGIAVDAAGNVYVADSGNLLVRKITAGGFVTTLGGALFTPGFNDGLGSGSRFSNLTPMSPFGGPTGVAVDGAGNVFVADQGSTGAGHTLRKISPAGNVTTLAGGVGLPGSADGTGIAAGFNSPAGVAVDGADRLYVVDTLNHTIRIQCPAHCECVEKIFVSYNNGTIRQFDSAGVATTFATGLNLPKGMAIGAGFLYVANAGANAILKFPTGGGASSPFSSSGLSSPYGIAFDGAGNLLVANYTSSTIQKLNGTGLPIAPFPVTSGNMNGAFDVIADAAGNLYTTSHNNNTIQKFDSAGNFVSDFVPFTSGLSAPRGLAIKAGVLYVANYGISSIKTFDLTTGNALADFATTADGLLNPVGIAFDSAGNLFVANAGNTSVMKFTAAHVGSTFSSIFSQSPDFIAIGCDSAGLNIALYPGLTITGSVGCQYRIEYTTFLNLNPTMTVWTMLTTLTLMTSPYLYMDASAPATGTRFYRAVPLP